MSSTKVLFGFHAVGVRLKTAPQSVIEIHFDVSRRDARMRAFFDRATEAGCKLLESDGLGCPSCAAATDIRAWWRG